MCVCVSVSVSVSVSVRKRESEDSNDARFGTFVYMYNVGNSNVWFANDHWGIACKECTCAEVENPCVSTTS